MTAGRGISHSEFSTPGTEILHGAQLWAALPDSARHVDPTFEHYRSAEPAGKGWALRVLLGSLAGSTLYLEGRRVNKDPLAFRPPNRESLALAAGSEPLRVLLTGSEPPAEKIVMWWNFVGRSHEKIAGYRAQWQAEIGAEAPPSAGGGAGVLRFGPFPARLRPRS